MLNLTNIVLPYNRKWSLEKLEMCIGFKSVGKNYNLQMYPPNKWVDKCMKSYHQFLFKKSAKLWDVWCVDGDEIHEISWKTYCWNMMV